MIPTGYITTDGDPSQDWAVIDFHGAGGPGSCGYSPGLSSGWVAPGIGNEAGVTNDYYMASMQEHAYDSAAPLPPQRDPNYIYGVPTLISRSSGQYRINVNPAAPWELSG